MVKNKKIKLMLEIEEAGYDATCLMISLGKRSFLWMDTHILRNYRALGKRRVLCLKFP